MNNSRGEVALRLTSMLSMVSFSLGAISSELPQIYPDIEPIEYKLERPAVRASVELKDARGRYQAYNVTDHNYQTAWCKGDARNVDNEWLTIAFQKDQKKIQQMVSAVKLKIIPGYVKTNSLFFENSRPRVAEIEILPFGRKNKSAIRKRLDIFDIPSTQVFKVDLNGSYNFYDLIVTLRFKEVFKGNKYDDMCISEVEVLPLDDRGEVPLRSGNVGAADDDSFMDSFGSSTSTPPYPESGLDEMHFLRLFGANYKDNPALMFEAVNWMAHSRYLRTAEGEESIKELWLDLYVKHPYQFLRTVELQEKEVRDFIISNSLIRQVNDKYSYGILYRSALAAKKEGVSSAVTAPLITEFSKNK